MVDYNKEIPNMLPKLPDDYWQKNEKVADARPSLSEINIFDGNLEASLNDIKYKYNKSVFTS